jgi:hypothetical protein
MEKQKMEIFSTSSHPFVIRAAKFETTLRNHDEKKIIIEINKTISHFSFRRVLC